MWSDLFIPPESFGRRLDHRRRYYRSDGSPIYHKISLGLFAETEWDTIGYEVVDCKEHQMKNEEMAKESCVLLKNDGLLPLQSDTVSKNDRGNWTQSGQSSRFQ